MRTDELVSLIGALAVHFRYTGGAPALLLLVGSQPGPSTSHTGRLQGRRSPPALAALSYVRR
jgi:hypothetical protein